MNALVPKYLVDLLERKYSIPAEKRGKFTLLRNNKMYVRNSFVYNVLLDWNPLKNDISFLTQLNCLT